MANILIKCNGILEDIVIILEKDICSNIITDEDEWGKGYVFTCMDLNFVLQDNYITDDIYNIPYSKYNYKLNVIERFENEKYNSYNELYFKVIIYLTEKIKDKLGCEVLAVERLHRIIKH